MLWVHLLALPQARAAEERVQAEALLAQSADVRLKNAPLGAALQRLSGAFGLPLWLDRRVDPTTVINLEERGATLGQLLARAAGQAGLGTALCGPVFYVGPPKEAERLREVTLRSRSLVRDLPPAVRRAYTRRGETVWPRLTEPRVVVEALLAQNGLRLQDSDAIPHDLWEGRELPSMPVADRLTLMLYGFGLEWAPSEEDPRVVRVGPIDGPRVGAK